MYMNRPIINNMRNILFVIAVVLIGIWAYRTFFIPDEPNVPSVISDERDESEVMSDKGELLIMEFPKQQDIITSPLVVTGQARGTWFFEASFPVVLTNWDGLIIAQGIAQAQGEWMTEEYVPFEATLEFEKPEYGENGFLILQKDNPSGLPQHDDAVEIPILFE